MIDVQVFFSDFVGSSRVQKPNKSQKERAHITGIQYFPVIWSCLHAHQQDLCQLLPIVYPPFITLSHNLCQLPFLPPPPPEYATTNRLLLPLGLSGHAKSYDRVAPRPLIKVDTTRTTYPCRCRPLRQPLRIQGRIHHLACFLQQSTPPRLWQSFLRHPQ